MHDRWIPSPATLGPDPEPEGVRLPVALEQALAPTGIAEPDPNVDRAAPPG